MQELLYDNTAPLETNLGVNVQLIDVVAEACLAPLATDNPFAVWDELIPTAVDSIAVIEAYDQKATTDSVHPFAKESRWTSTALAASRTRGHGVRSRTL